MAFNNSGSADKGYGDFYKNPDFPQDELNYTTPFEFPKGPDDDDFFKKLKLGLVITLLVIVFAFVPGVITFFVLLGKAFFGWAANIF
jgi:hypothetical protein